MKDKAIKEKVGSDIGATMVYQAVEDKSEKTDDKSGCKYPKKNSQNKKKAKTSLKVKIAAVAAAALAVTAVLTYLGIGYIYFKDRFYKGTYINGFDCSGETVAQVYSLFETAVDDFTLTINKEGETLDVIKSSDVGLNTGNTLHRITEVCELQEGLDWIKYYIKPRKTEITIDNVYEYDDNKLNSVISGLNAMNEKNAKKSINAKLQYQNGNYRIIPAVYGNEISKEALRSLILIDLQKLKPEINVEKEGCYIMPSVTENTPELMAANSKLNKILNSNITLVLINKYVPMTKEAVNSWLSIDDKYNVTPNEDTISSYVNVVAAKYSSYKKDRSFKTSYGDTVNVRNGDYGRQVNAEKLKQRLTEAVATGENTTIDVPFSRGAMGSLENDLGTTYIEVDLTNQRLWMYVKGQLVCHTDVVTGKDDGAHYTPEGTYKLKYKQLDAVLRGDNYETPVKYWMPFNGDIGLHDAVWQPKFGGDWYKKHGSHGCVNLPISMAEKIYNNAVVNMPVICYYHTKVDLTEAN